MSRMRYSLLILGLASTASTSVYDHGSGVVDLSPLNFDLKVKRADGIWIVEFYAPWCGHCKNLAPEYQKAAKALRGVINLGAVDCDNQDNKPLCSQYGVQGFPTIKVFADDKNKPTDYNGQRTASGITDQAMRVAKDTVNQRLTGRPGGSGRGSGSSGKDVLELTESNFDKEVMMSEDMWLVEFFAPWCGHCKNLEPHWKKAAGELKGKVKLGAVDATVHQSLAGRYGVQGYPTIKFFPAGRKSDHPEDYDGGRTASDIVQWGLQRHVVSLPPPEVVQLTSQDVLDGNCEGKQLCIAAFLPDILDSGANGRNSYLDVMKKVGEKYKNNGWGWLWSAALDQAELEESLGVGGFGYPALAVISIKKGKCAVMRGSFSQDGINEFLRDTLYGKASTATIRGGKLPLMKKVESWDGKDGQIPVEDDVDLSDVDLDKDEL